MSIQTNQLVVVGINYKTASIAERELFQINKKEMPAVLNYFNSKPGIDGVVIISTCNRVEFYLAVKSNIDPFSIIANYYFDEKEIDTKSKRNLFYTLKQTEVAKHLFSVISGIESMLFGEYQIQGQIKDSYSIACSENAVDKFLHKLFHAAFRTGKSVRSKTKIGTGKQSLSGIAFQLIKENLNLDEHITIIGVNESSKILANKLHGFGFKNLNFVNRTLFKAEELSHKYNGKAFKLNQLKQALLNSSCLFTSTGAPGLIVKSEQLKENTDSLKLIIDMAIPRDVDTSELKEDIKVFDLEGLKKYLADQTSEITSDLPIAEKIIADEASIFEVWNDAQKDDILGQFSEKVELLRLQLLDETKVQFCDHEVKFLDKFSKSLLHRVKSVYNQAIKAAEEEKEKRELV
jgi:glutamyl-tRNA reductase